MAFSRFDEKLAFPESLAEFDSIEQPIESAVQRMLFILENHQTKLRQFTVEILSKSSSYAVENLRNNISQTWSRPGQQIIVDKVFK